MDIEAFRGLPAEEIAQLVRQAGSSVCVFPINGTRRWFLLEHPDALEQGDDFAATYLDLTGRRHIELYRLLFEHGLDTLLTPVFGPDLLDRGAGYMQIAAEGLTRLAMHPDFRTFYDEHDVRVRFYGDYQKFFHQTPYAYLVDQFREVTERTLAHMTHRLFFGVCAQDAAGSVAELGIRYYLEHHAPPDKETLIRLYYGEQVDPVALFIGFDKLCVFDMPLLASGNEDLYFTVEPSPYLDANQLRDILYDHLYARRGGETDYSTLTAEEWALMHEFYRTNRGRTLGVGLRKGQEAIWYPLPQVELPPGFLSTLKTRSR